MLVEPEVAVVATVAVAAVDAAEVDVALFLPRLDGTLGASVALMTAVFFSFSHLLMWRWPMKQVPYF